MIGAEAFGPTCARRLGMTPKKLAKSPKVRFMKPVPRETIPETLDLFDDIERQE